MVALGVFPHAQAYGEVLCPGLDTEFLATVHNSRQVQVGLTLMKPNFMILIR